MNLIRVDHRNEEKKKNIRLIYYIIHRTVFRTQTQLPRVPFSFYNHVHETISSIIHCQKH